MANYSNDSKYVSAYNRALAASNKAKLYLSDLNKANPNSAQWKTLKAKYDSAKAAADTAEAERKQRKSEIDTAAKKIADDKKKAEKKAADIKSGNADIKVLEYELQAAKNKGDVKAQAKAEADLKVARDKAAGIVTSTTSGTGKTDNAKTVVQKPEDFAGLLKTAPQFIAKMKPADRKLLAQSLNDALGLKLPVTGSIDPQTLLGAYVSAISGAQARYNVFKDVFTVDQYLKTKKLETAAAKAAGAGTGKAPTVTDYPVVSSITDAEKLINDTFQTNLKRDATAAEIKLLFPLLQKAQLAQPTVYKKTILNGKEAQIQYSGLDAGQWLLDQINSNTTLNLKTELNKVKTESPELFKREAEKKIYDDLIAKANGDAATIQKINETTTYGRGFSELLSDIQSLAETNAAINTPEELTALAKKLYDKGIASNSAKATEEINAVLKTDAGLIKDLPQEVITRAANKKIYDKLIAAAGGDTAKIENINNTTAYGRGFKELLAAIQSSAEDNAATNTPEELTALAKQLYDSNTTLDSAKGKAALKSVLKTGSTLVKGQSTALVQRLAEKKVYDDLITAAAGDADKIKTANETTDYGRGLKELTAAIQSKAKASSATNTPEELTALAKTLYDKGILLESAEGTAQLDATLKAGDVLVKDQQADLLKKAADKKIYETQLAAAGDDPAKIQKVMDTTAYGRGLKEVLSYIQSKASDSGAINTVDELKTLAQDLYDRGISTSSFEFDTALGNVLKTKNGLVKDQPVDLQKLAADKAVYDKLIAAANGDAAAIAKAKATTSYGRDLASIEAYITKLASEQGATNDPTEIATLAQDLYDKGIKTTDAQFAKQVNSVLKYGADAVTGRYKGTAGTNIADLQATAVANGLDLEKNFGSKIGGWLTALNSGEKIDNIKQQIRDVAKLGQPDSVKKLIDNGNNLSDIYAPYKNTMAATLDIQNPDSIDFNDPTLRMAITPTGEMNLYDYTKALRKDNRWQYTKQANQEVADTTQKVLRDFGFMG